ncbi:aromatic ring-hydroxylating dioxygenase subunit alpha [Oscillatoria sp. CS-180]|uniref:aromatic ring-hydroxylating dioxygenase subunit alpha n=1 Tax=Oscillatoria sp. CS-180 TaxID=3021720 RepID=UPI00232D1F9D|nr:aromatic ring-hydroxylating dioxygenase subunit alpha [Oscillatoria sp. CS-180]MDB9529825.1 aromatic ring-hydroxylating dioxygenase subunit alpha [Oscillatoria sp. CS-180]
MVAIPPTPTPDTPVDSAVSKDVRSLGINSNHWYVVARADEVTDKPLGVMLWGEAIVLFRDTNGHIQALEDRCPHRQVKLSQGEVVDGELECVYHGWRFNAAGKCTEIPYLADNQKLPGCTIRQFPVQELDGFIWLYPGDRDQLIAADIKPLGLPEWDHLNYIATVSIIDVEAHYSFLIENLMDMYHGRLHDDYQAWADPVLANLEMTDQRVDVLYDAQSYYRIDKIWSVSQLFFPALRKLHPEELRVSYIYPHWVSTLGQDFKICCLFCPISPTHTRAYLVHFTSLQAFHRLHKLPVPFRRWIKNSLFGSAQKMLDGLVAQDVLMLEQEQQSYNENPLYKGPEFNRAMISVQKLIRQQAQSRVASIHNGT